jgi:hypothetical protein
MGYNARNDEIRDNVTPSRWLAVLLFCLTWTQLVSAQENLPGQWHFAEAGESKSCVLVGEGFKSGLAIIKQRLDKPDFASREAAC